MNTECVAVHERSTYKRKRSFCKKSKKYTIWKIDINSLSARSLQSLLLLFFDDFAAKNEEFYNPTIKEVLAAINAIPHQLFAVSILARYIYPELKKYFCKKHSAMT